MISEYGANTVIPDAHRADTAKEARRWVRMIGRRPLAVISRQKGRMEPPSMLLLSTTLNGLADIILLNTPAAADAFNAAAGERYAVHGSVVRAIGTDGDTWYWPSGRRTPAAIARSTAAWLRQRRGPRPAASRERAADGPATPTADAQPAGDGLPDTADWFTDPGDRMDLDVRIAWAKRIPACEKPHRPLPGRWAYAPGFLDTVAATEANVGRARILNAVVDALTGLDERLPGRDRHMLRENSGADSGPRMGPWGNPIWRTSITIGPGGWRLHVTRDGDGTLTLLEVAHHDRGLR